MEKIRGGYADFQIEGGRRVRAKIVSGQITFTNNQGKEITPRKKMNIPEGTITSLKPLLQEALDLFGEDQGDGYLEKLVQNAPFAPDEACRKLKKAGIDHIHAARLLLNSEPRVMEFLAHEKLDDETLNGFVSIVSSRILREYNKK